MKGMSREDRDSLLDKDFFDFATYMILPGGCCNRSEIIELFRSGFQVKYRQFEGNPNFQVSDLEVELLLFRWNNKYAKADVDSNGIYKGFHIRESKSHRSTSVETKRSQQQAIPSHAHKLSQNQPKKASPRQEQRQKSSISSKNQSSSKLLRMALEGKVHGDLSESDLKALNFQMEQVALASSLEESQNSLQDKKQKAPPYYVAKKNLARNDSSDQKQHASECPQKVTSRSASKNPRFAAAKGVAKAPPVSMLDRNEDDDVKIYPQSVKELVMNGFKRSHVISAYELIGDNFDELLMYLVSLTKVE